MLDPNADRIDYGKLLAPHTGYTLDFAVGTTYSLDLNALVGACMSLSLGEETDSELLDNPVYVLDTLHRVSDKLVLFCDGGQIKVPQKVTKLHALLENVVFEVVMPKKRGATPSFHPKMWLLRYKGADMSSLYRVIVLSRNLTFDRSWDIVFSMDGAVSEEQTEKNAPLKELLCFLADKLPGTSLGREKKRRIRSFVSELDRVHFELKKPFSDYEFVPIGIDRTPTDICTALRLSGRNYDEIFVMSPFLSNGVVKALNGVAEKAEAILITRKEALSKLRAEDCSRFRIFCMRDEVVNGEGMLSDGESENVQQQDIHAKLYLTRRSSSVEISLGSMNASHSALTGNIELMVRLKTLNRYLNLSKLKEELFGKDETKNPFESVDITQLVQESSDASRLDKIVKAVCSARPYAAVTAGESYRIEMTIPNCEKIDLGGAEVSICPLFSTRQKQIAGAVEFEGLSLGELTCFYRISVKRGEDFLERVVIVPTEGIPAARDDTIISSYVCDQKSFVQYLAFLLGDEPTLSAFEATHTAAGNGSKVGLTALYEKMLFVAAHEPARFKEIDFLMKSIHTENVVPQEFTKLYETFKRVVKANE